MKRAVILVDYDNVANLHSVNPKPSYQNVVRSLNYIIEKIATWTDNDTTLLDELYFRFYGGWFMENEEETERYKMLSKATYQYGRRIGKYRIHLRLVDSLSFAGDRILKRTLQCRPYNKKIKLLNTVRENCIRNNNCNVSILADWLENGCQHGCDVHPNSILQTTEQKTVDTSMACDAIHYSILNEYEYIGIVSGDYDIVPAIIFAICNGTRVVQFRKKDTLFYDNLISECEIVSDVLFKH